MSLTGYKDLNILHVWLNNQKFLNNYLEPSLNIRKHYRIFMKN